MCHSRMASSQFATYLADLLYLAENLNFGLEVDYCIAIFSEGKSQPGIGTSGPLQPLVHSAAKDRSEPVPLKNSMLSAEYLES